MNNQPVDVYVYINSKGGDQISAELISKLSQVAGVASINKNRNISKLLDIKYDPKKQSAINLVNIVKQHGHSASLVGM